MKRVKLTITLCIIAAMSGLLISLVNGITAPIVKENAAEKEKMLYTEIFAETASFEKVEGVTATISEQVIIKDGSDQVIGYVYKVSGVNGYGSITALVGVDLDQNIKGIQYSAFAQTPGFGDKVKKPVFMNQFVGMPTNDISVDIQAGATYSSNLVGQLVADVAAYHKDNVKE